jgi:serine/threonine protein kinase
VYRVFEHDKLRRIYLLMDYVKGRNLETLRKEQPEQRFALPLVLALLATIVDALIYLHCQDPPIVHRDIKPANIIVPVGADEAVLVDFGSAKEYVADSTTTAIRLGSPGYAALEQYGSGTTSRTVIYCLGSTLYTLLTCIFSLDAITRAT